MSDRKSIAIVLGTALGVAAVAAVIGVYVARSRGVGVVDVNEMFSQARETVQDIEKAVTTLRRSET